MRKRVKRIPKYNRGTGIVMPEAPIDKEKLWGVADNMDKQLNTLNPYLTEMSWADMNAKQKTGSIIGAAGTAVNLAANSIGKPVTAAGIANGALQGAAAGAAIGGPWGAAIGAVGGGLLSSIGTGGSVDYNTGEVTMPSGIAGMFGHSKGYLMHKGNMVRNSILSRLQTENLKADYMNQYGGAVKVAEGGIMRRPVDALVSKGELIYDPTTLKLRQVPGSKGKPNKADDVYAKLYEGDVVISNSPTMLMANGKTPAQNLMGMVDKYATGGTVKAREAIIKKVVNWQEANKTKPQEYNMYSKGTGKDGAQPITEDTVLRRPERVYDYEEPAKTVTAPVDDTKVYGRDGSVRYDYTTPERKVTDKELGRTKNNNNKRRTGSNSHTGSNWQDGLYRMAVLSQPLWDRAKAEPIDWTSPVYKYMPTQIDVNSQFRDVDQSYALARYNFANLYPNTGAGMAAGLQAASDRAKQYADIRQYQTNAQNELIGKNVGIYNNLANEHAKILNDVYNKSAQNRAAARNINRQNRAAALSNLGTMLSDDKKMAMDKLKLDMLEPMLQYGYLNYNNYLKWKNTNGYD